MNNECGKIRETIEDSIGRELSNDERAALDRHCDTCESCREYRDRLIEDDTRLERFAACLMPSEQRAEDKVIQGLPVEAPVRAKRPGFGSLFASVPRFGHIAAAAVILIAIIIAIDFLRGVLNGPVPAFASVLEKMEKAENVVYRDREWSLGTWRTIQRAYSQSGCSRVEYADSTYMSHRSEADTTQDVVYDTSIVWCPATQRAVMRTSESVPFRLIIRRLNSETSTPKEKARYRRLMTGHPSTTVQRMASWHKREGFSFLRTERRDGRNAAVYVSGTGTGGHYKWTTWVDLDTGLPFRIEIVRPDNIPYGLKLIDFVPAGLPLPAAPGWIALGPGEPSAIYDDFHWNTKLDTSYFSLTPPPGYSVTRIEPASKEESADWERRWREGVPFEASELAKTLSIWTSLSGGSFPDDIHDLGDSAKVRPLLIAKHDKEGVPGDELRAAISDAREIMNGFPCVRYYGERLHYLGGGTVFGDSTRVLCWGELTGQSREFFTHPYWIIYADLHCVASATPPEIHEK